jgi:DNA-binding helix-hairpin-helix protein with protein kinase domain
MDDDTDDKALGSGALFIENPLDKSARYDAKWAKDDCKRQKELPYIFPWHDLDKLPYTCLGQYLSDVIERAFVKGLHNPSLRPTAAEWEFALERTIPLLKPCDNPNCPAKWYVASGDSSGSCPFCG